MRYRKKATVKADGRDGWVGVVGEEAIKLVINQLSHPRLFCDRELEREREHQFDGCVQNFDVSEVSLQ